MDGDLSFEKKNIDLTTPQHTEQISNDPEDIQEPTHKSPSIGGIFSGSKRENSLGNIKIEMANKNVDQCKYKFSNSIRKKEKKTKIMQRKTSRNLY